MESNFNNAFCSIWLVPLNCNALDIFDQLFGIWKHSYCNKDDEKTTFKEKGREEVIEDFQVLINNSSNPNIL